MTDQKPAPDAMREATIIRVSKRLAQMADNIGGMHAPELERLSRALSAPVPPPDGARREIDTTLQMISATAADAALRDTVPSPSDDVRSALAAVKHWASSKCPCENDLPDPCPLCGATVSGLEGCKAIEGTLPKKLLDQINAALRSAPVSAPADIETIAAIIDPHAFVIPNSKRPDTQDRQAAARGKAKEILALSAPAVRVTREAIIRECIISICNYHPMLYAPEQEGRHPRDAAIAGTKQAIIRRLESISTAPDATVSEPVAWADREGRERPIDAVAMKMLQENPTTKTYWERFDIPLYTSPQHVGREGAASVSEYLRDYTFRVDGADYTPHENEKELIEDAIRGYLAEIQRANFQEAAVSARDAVIEECAKIVDNMAEGAATPNGRSRAELIASRIRSLTGAKPPLAPMTDAQAEEITRQST